MRSVWSAAALAALLVLSAPLARPGATQDATAAMQGHLGEQVLDGCNTELAWFCAEVSPGEVRLLACLYAHGDKLSGQCDYALYNAAVRLERAFSAITYVASECRAELETHCANFDVGEGRVAQCLKDHANEVSPRLRSCADRSGREMRLAWQSWQQGTPPVAMSILATPIGLCARDCRRAARVHSGRLKGAQFRLPRDDGIGPAPFGMHWTA